MTKLWDVSHIIESVDSISRDERDSPQMQYITNVGTSHARYTIMQFKHHHCVLQVISNPMSVCAIYVHTARCKNRDLAFFFLFILILILILH